MNTTRNKHSLIIASKSKLLIGGLAVGTLTILPATGLNAFATLFRHSCFEMWRGFGNAVAAFTIIFCLLIPALLKADNIYGDFYYTLSDSEVTITAYTGSDTELTIPDAIDGYPVTTIGGSAFYNSTSLTSVTIPSSVTTIGSSAFGFCKNLTSITIPDSVTSIGNYVFEYCYSLTSVTIPDSVTSIGICAFCRCTSLTCVTIPDSVTSIGIFAFCYCSRLTSVTIGSGVTLIDEEAFEFCYNLLAVVFRGDAPTMGSDVFYGVASGFCIYYPAGATGYDVSPWTSYTLYSYTITEGPTWSDSTESITSPDWYASSWYGWFYTDTSSWGNWIYQENHGWQYVDGSDDGTAYIYDNATGDWWFTSKAFYPYIYDYANSTWLFYYDGVTPSREFYDYATNSLVGESSL